VFDKRSETRIATGEQPADAEIVGRCDDVNVGHVSLDRPGRR
jgi:hypothetical protein